MRTYGNVTLAGRYWTVETEPHVSLRLKRVFKNMNKNEYGKLHVYANPANSLELMWFLQRYPMTLTAYDQSRLEELTQEQKTK